MARNEANGSSIVGTAESDGSFKLSLALAGGVNKITIDGTDPAGNQQHGHDQRQARHRQADRQPQRVALPDQAIEAAARR